MARRGDPQVGPLSLSCLSLSFSLSHSHAHPCSLTRSLPIWASRVRFVCGECECVLVSWGHVTVSIERGGAQSRRQCPAAGWTVERVREARESRIVPRKTFNPQWFVPLSSATLLPCRPVKAREGCCELAASFLRGHCEEALPSWTSWSRLLISACLSISNRPAR